MNRIYSNRSHSDEQKQLMFSKISNYVETEISALDSNLNVEQSVDSLSLQSNGSCYEPTKKKLRDDGEEVTHINSFMKRVAVGKGRKILPMQVQHFMLTLMITLNLSSRQVIGTFELWQQH